MVLATVSINGLTCLRLARTTVLYSTCIDCKEISQNYTCKCICQTSNSKKITLIVATSNITHYHVTPDMNRLRIPFRFGCERLFNFYITHFPSYRSVTLHIKSETCYLSRDGIAKVPKEACSTLGFYEKVEGIYCIIVLHCMCIDNIICVYID